MAHFVPLASSSGPCLAFNNNFTYLTDDAIFSDILWSHEEGEEPPLLYPSPNKRVLRIFLVAVKMRTIGNF